VYKLVCFFLSSPGALGQEAASGSRGRTAPLCLPLCPGVPASVFDFVVFALFVVSSHPAPRLTMILSVPFLLAGVSTEPSQLPTAALARQLAGDSPVGTAQWGQLAGDAPPSPRAGPCPSSDEDGAVSSSFAPVPGINGSSGGGTSVP